MGKSTISMAIFNSYVNVYQRVNLHFPVVFLWFSYGLSEGNFPFDTDSTPALQLTKTAPWGSFGGSSVEKVMSNQLAITLW